MKKELYTAEQDKYDFIHKAKHYSKKIPRFKWFKEEDDFTRALASAFKEVESVLDAGCGKCAFSKFLSNRYEIPLTNFFGIDISKKALEGCPSKMKVVKGSIDKIPFPNKFFHMVLHLDGMEHIYKEYEDEVFKELLRVSKKFVFLSIYTKSCHEDTVSTLEGHTPLHVNLKSVSSWKKKIEKVCEENNFSIYFFDSVEGHVRTILQRYEP